VRRILVALGLGAVLLAGTALSAPRGKVVRIERPRARTAAARFCVVMDSPEKLLCIGKAPVDGEVITFLDQRGGGVIGTARTESAQPSRMYTCPGREATIFDVTATVTTGDVSVISRGYTLALRGLQLDERAKVIEDYRPAQPSEQSVLVAIDTDGDSTADIVMFQYTCDAQGNMSPLGGGGSGNTNTQCYDTYVDRGGTLVRTHQDIIELCY
jgi:hypothetical protein